MRNPVNSAHRGASGMAPENTFAAFDLALAHNADRVELDAHLTGDSRVAIIHDDTLERTARRHGRRVPGRIGSETVESLRDLDAGTWFNETWPDRAKDDYRGEQIPTLAEVVRRYGSVIDLCIDLKQPQHNRLEEQVVAELGAGGDRPRRSIVVQSASRAALQRVRELRADLPLVQLFDRVDESAGVRAQLRHISSYATGIGPAAHSIDWSLMAEAHSLGLEVHAYTVNSPGEMRRLIGLGVDGIFTDWPHLLARLLAPYAAA